MIKHLQLRDTDLIGHLQHYRTRFGQSALPAQHLREHARRHLCTNLQLPCIVVYFTVTVDFTTILFSTDNGDYSLKKNTTATILKKDSKNQILITVLQCY
jgi:hypothetical protein